MVLSPGAAPPRRYCTLHTSVQKLRQDWVLSSVRPWIPLAQLVAQLVLKADISENYSALIINRNQIQF